MRVIIAGSRTIKDYHLICLAITESGFDTITEVVSGHAVGVDQLGEQWAKEYGVDIRLFLPEWRKFGPSAGFLRNKEMGRYADALIAVWDGESKGTKQMIDFMKKLGKPVYVKEAKPTLIIPTPERIGL